MNASIRKVALALGIAFVVLLVDLNYVQLSRSAELSQDPRNRRRAYAEESVKRGEILAADSSLVARSVRSGDAQFVWARRYPQGSLFGQISGYYTSPFFCQSAGVESTQNAFLTGEEPKTAQDFVDELLGRAKHGNTVKLTIYPKLQKLARMKFGDQIGGAAVIDTRTGAVLGLYGNPTFNPNDVTEQNLGGCAAPLRQLDRDARKPLLSRAYQVRYPAGSTFKIITMSAAIEFAKYNLRTYIPVKTRLSLRPYSNLSLGNFGGSTCGGTLLRSLEVSCNTAFAQVALKTGLKKLNTMAERYGLNEPLPFDLDAVSSCLASPEVGRDCLEPTFGNAFPPYAGIGQQSVGVTPLQMALVIGTVANGGILMRPHVVAKILDADNAELRKIKPSVVRRVLSKRTASLMRTALLSVVCRGTGRIVGFKRACRGVGGKTGTAQTSKGKAPHVWFVAFDSGIAVAVVVEHGGSLRSEATGGKVAGPIAKALLEYAVEHHYHG